METATKEALSVWIPVSLALTALLLLLVYTFLKQAGLRRLGIPGPYPVPFLGSVRLAKALGIYGMDDFLRKKFGDFVGFYLFNEPQLVVADAPLIEEICNVQTDVFANRAESFYLGKFLSTSVSVTKDAHWKFTRSLLNPSFGPDSIEQLLPVINKCTEQLIKNISQRNEASLEINELLGAHVLDCLCLAIFGIEADSLNNPEEPFVANARVALADHISLPRAAMSALFPACKGCVQDDDYISKECISFFCQAVTDIMENRRQTATKRTDVLQMMMDTQTEQPSSTYQGESRGLSDEEILSNGLGFILAGCGTTTTALTWSVFCLADNVSCQEDLWQEVSRTTDHQLLTYDEIGTLERLDMVLSESLRMYPPPARFSRNTSADTAVCGWTVPKGVDVFMPVYAIHHDQNKWPEPETFRPERFSSDKKPTIPPQHYVPFGFGPRYCIGKYLGILICKVALIAIVKNFELAIDPRTEMPPPIGKHFFAKPEKEIYVHMESRQQKET